MQDQEEFMKKSNIITSSLKIPDKNQLSTKDSDVFYKQSQKVIEYTDPTHHYYTIISSGLKEYILDKRPDLNKYIKYNIFRANKENQETKDEIINALKNCVATVYAACIDNEIKLSDSSSIYEVISQDLVELVGVEIAGDIISSINETP